MICFRVRSNWSLSWLLLRLELVAVRCMTLDTDLTY